MFYGKFGVDNLSLGRTGSKKMSNKLHHRVNSNFVRLPSWFNELQNWWKINYPYWDEFHTHPISHLRPLNVKLTNFFMFWLVHSIWEHETSGVPTITKLHLPIINSELEWTLDRRKCNDDEESPAMRTSPSYIALINTQFWGSGARDSNGISKLPLIMPAL